MQVFESMPHAQVTPSEVAKLIPFEYYTLDVHMRQLYALKCLSRPKRGVYKFLAPLVCATRKKREPTPVFRSKKITAPTGAQLQLI